MMDLQFPGSANGQRRPPAAKGAARDCGPTDSGPHGAMDAEVNAANCAGILAGSTLTGIAPGQTSQPDKPGKTGNKFRPESETDSQPTKRNRYPVAPSSSADQASLRTVIAPDGSVGSLQRRPSRYGAVASGRREENCSGLEPSRNRTLESGEAGVVNVGGEPLESQIDGWPVGDVTAWRDTRKFEMGTSGIGNLSGSDASAPSNSLSGHPRENIVSSGHGAC